jgi:hypothetical protein
MTKTNRLTIGVLMLLATVAPGFAQDGAPEPKFYRLDFVVKELEGGKVSNARNYSMTISTARNGPSSAIRSGGKIPVQTGSLPVGDVANTQFTYVDVGVNIDCRGAREISDHLAMTVVSEISNALHTENGKAPVIRKTQWSSEVIVPLRKPTTIFSSDDAGSKMQMQLELTATPIK